METCKGCPCHLKYGVCQPIKTGLVDSVEDCNLLPDLFPAVAAMMTGKADVGQTQVTKEWSWGGVGHDRVYDRYTIDIEQERKEDGDE